MIGQILKKFFPNSEKPDINPIFTMVSPLKDAPENLRIHMEIPVTMPEFINAAPGPAIYT